MQDAATTPQQPSALVRNRPSIRRHLQSVFEGGPAGQRKAALLFLVWVAPISMIVTAVLASERRIEIIVLRAWRSWSPCAGCFSAPRSGSPSGCS
jgi:hypothetical protein